MITATRPAMQARSINTDYKSLVQTKLANGLLDYYMREHRLEDYIKTAVEYSLNMASGYVKIGWNATSGDVYDYNEELGYEIREGDLEFSNLSIFDVYFDTHREDNKHDWVLARTYKNRFDVAAKYPELSDKILRIQTKDNIDKFQRLGVGVDDTDLIPVYEFFHKRTEAVPDGKYHLFLDKDVSLIETPIPYRDLPIYCIAPAYYLGTPYPYTPMFDLMGLQDGVNSLYSTVLTNQTAFGVQNILVPQGANVNISELSGGLHVIESNQLAGEIKPLQLTSTPQEVFKMIEMLEKAMETTSGVNSVARGNPDPNLRSGTALALVQSMTLQYISGLQQSYVNLVEDLGTGMINILKDHANVPRIAAIVGKNHRSELKEFTGKDLASISRVVVDIGNPLARSTAGRVEMAEQLLKMGAITTPQHYFSVINTGQLDVMTESEQSQLFLVKAENEKLAMGKEVIAIFTDEHALHIKEHSTVLSDPELRFDTKLTNMVAAHIQEHIDLLQNTRPEILQILGQSPLPPPMPPQGMPPQGPPPPNSIPQGGSSGGPPSSPPPANMEQNAVLNPPMNQMLQQQGMPPIKNKLPSIDPNLLSNPDAQQAAMGNVKQ